MSRRTNESEMGQGFNPLLRLANREKWKFGGLFSKLQQKVISPQAVVLCMMCMHNTMVIIFYIDYDPIVGSQLLNLRTSVHTLFSNRLDDQATKRRKILANLGAT